MAQNFNPMSTQNILNISKELGVTPHYAMNLVKQSLQGIEQGPLDILSSELTQQTLKPQTVAQSISKFRTPLFSGAGQVLSKASLPLTIGSALYKLSNFNPRNIELSNQYHQNLKEGKRLPNIIPGVGFMPQDLQEYGQDLPLVQVNNDGSLNTPLQGQVNYDEYLLEPNDNIWVQPVSELQAFKDSINPQDYTTKLNPLDSIRFNLWAEDMKRKGVINPQDNFQDYNMRGYWKNEVLSNSELSNGNAQSHFTDKYKMPNHPTFSNESMYATGPNARYAGSWNEDTFIPPQF